VFAVQEEIGRYGEGHHLIRIDRQNLLADVEQSAMWAVEELAELIESDLGLLRLALTVLDTL